MLAVVILIRGRALHSGSAVPGIVWSRTRHFPALRHILAASSYVTWLSLELSGRSAVTALLAAGRYLTVAEGQVVGRDGTGDREISRPGDCSVCERGITAGNWLSRVRDTHINAGMA